MDRPTTKRSLELWAGVECTVNRVGDRFLDQLVLTGHHDRPADLDLLASLGASAVRYPVLWERVARAGPRHADWSWSDERLGRLRELGLRPIVGLVHHGSGPPETSLVDPAFPEKLALYARRVAERYPWVEDWTPVNEPLTTARFSGLYGHWYPHGRDPRTFAQCLLGQCRGIVLAMRAIREVSPAARLVQTEDLGEVASTPLLRYQARFENERRWVSFDLLTGRLELDGPVACWLREAGVSRNDLDWFRQNACPPDIVGLNHYLSSDRFLDDRLEHHPEREHGGNGTHRYADLLAARVLRDGAPGPEEALRAAWDRYRLPLAVTETHNGCTREEQLRWLLEVWRSAQAARADAIDVRAVTVWSAFGASGWDQLVTQQHGRYEPGAFDARGAAPRATALAGLARALVEGAQVHPVAEGPGWWRRGDRFSCPPVATGPRRSRFRPPPSSRPLLVTGATGTLGQAFARACGERGLSHRLLSRADLDIADPSSTEAALGALDPWAVVNTAGFVRVDEAETDPDRCRRENSQGAAVLASVTARRAVPFVTFSSDLVFDGAKREPYVEDDAPAPLSVYGETKAEAERRTLEEHPEALVVRTSAFFGPDDEHNFVTVALRALAEGASVQVPCDQVVSPTYVPHLVDATLDLLVDGASGMWHLTNQGALTWAELAATAARACGVTADELQAVPSHVLPFRARRPRWSVLGTERGVPLAPLDEALAAYASARVA